MKIPICPVHPTGPIVWRTPRKAGETHDAPTCCRGTRFFASQQALDEWRNKLPAPPDGSVLSLAEALDRGRRLFGDLLE